jgi:hypothetical protein
MFPPAPYFQRMPAKIFQLPTPPTCPHPLYSQLLNNNIIPRHKPLYNPMAITHKPLHPCSVNATPEITLQQTGAMVPILGGPEEILPQHAVVPIPGTLEKVQLAFLKVQDAVDRGEQCRNPLDDGDIIIPPGGGPFIFVPGPEILGLPVDEGRARARIDQSQLQKKKPIARAEPAFPRADLTFDLSDLVTLPDMNEAVAQLPVQPCMALATDTSTQGLMQAPVQTVMPLAAQRAVLDLNHPDDSVTPDELQAEPPVKKNSVTVTYERRRSERLKHKMDGARVDSVERASQRKASYTGDSDSSLSSASTRRRKTRRLPDINKLAPMPVTECPPKTDIDRLQDLAACCGFMTLEAIEKALKKHNKGKQIQGTSELNE